MNHVKYLDVTFTVHFRIKLLDDTKQTVGNEESPCNKTSGKRENEIFLWRSLLSTTHTKAIYKHSSPYTSKL
jgi:hypothetical protein